MVKNLITRLKFIIVVPLFLSTTVTAKEHEPATGLTGKVTALFCTSNNQMVKIDSKNFSTLLQPSCSTKFITHGYHSRPTDPWIRTMASRYHQNGNYNVIAVDWSEVAFGSYIKVSAATETVGNLIADLIIKMAEKTPYFLDNLHLIGHSLGAHVFGFAGKRVHRVTGKKIDRITALDAASPLFETPVLQPPNRRFAKSDAAFTDAIHTDTVGLRGMMISIGVVDFYVNLGIAQLNCSDSLPNGNEIDSCNHASVHFYFTQTISKPRLYKGRTCPNILKYKYCNKTAYMGEGVSKDARGDYFVWVDKDDSCNHASVHFYFTQTISKPRLYKGRTCPNILKYKYCNKTAYMGEGVSKDARGDYFVWVDKDGNSST